MTTATGPVGQDQTGAKKTGRARIIWGAALMIVSPFVFIGLILVGVFIDRIPAGSPLVSLPGPSRIQLDPGTYGVLPPYDGSGFYAADLEVTGPSGPVTVTTLDGFFSSGVETTQDGVRYEANARFTAPTAGSYELKLNDRVQHDKTVQAVVAPYHNGEWTFGMFLAGFGISFVAGVAGIVLLISGLVGRSRAKKRSLGPPVYVGQPAYPGGGMPPQPAPAPQPPPAVYPQPAYPPQPGYPPAPPPPGPTYPPQPAYPPQPPPNAPPHQGT